MKTQNSILVIFILMINYSIVFSQTEISGTVNALYPPEGISVIILNANTDSLIYTTQTNYQGKFTFSNVSSGIYKLAFMGRYVVPSGTEVFTVSNEDIDVGIIFVTPKTPTKIAYFYCLALFAPEEFIEFIENNRGWLESDSEFLNSLENLSLLFKNQATNVLSYDEVYERSLDYATNIGIPGEIAERTARDQLKAKSEFMALSRQLSELRNSINAILNNDPTYFYNTELYLFSQLFQPILEDAANLFGLGYIQFLFSLSFEVMYAYASFSM